MASDEQINATITTIGNAAMTWRSIAEQMERERNQAFADLAAANATIEAQALVIAQTREDFQRAANLLRDEYFVPTKAMTRDASDVVQDVIEILHDLLRMPPTAAVEQAAAVLKAGEAMAESIAELLSGGIEMKPVTEGPVTFEAMLMLIQMLGVHRDAYRRARLALSLAGSGEG